MEFNTKPAYCENHVLLFTYQRIDLLREMSFHALKVDVLLKKIVKVDNFSK